MDLGFLEVNPEAKPSGLDPFKNHAHTWKDRFCPCWRFLLDNGSSFPLTWGKSGPQKLDSGLWFKWGEACPGRGSGAGRSSKSFPSLLQGFSHSVGAVGDRAAVLGRCREGAAEASYFSKPIILFPHCFSFCSLPFVSVLGENEKLTPAHTCKD